MPATQYTTTFDAPIDTVYKVLTNYANYPDFVDGSDGAEVLEMEDEGGLVRFSINVIKEFTYVLKMTHERPGSIRWEFQEGDLFKRNDGFWKLSDNGDGTTDAHYELDMDFKLMVPKMILKKLINNNLPKMMDQYNNQIVSQK